MPSPQQLEAIAQQERRQQQLRGHYAMLRDNPAMLDLVGWLDLMYTDAYGAAVDEVDNPTKALASLQHASAYDKVRSYISSMAEPKP